MYMNQTDSRKIKEKSDNISNLCSTDGKPHNAPRRV